MTSALSAAATVVASASSASSSSSKLVQLANGKYTASSVASDQTDASKLGLVKEKDGNYGTSAPPVATTGSAAAQTSSGVQSALTSLTLGGA